VFGFPHRRSLYRTAPAVNGERAAAGNGPNARCERVKRRTDSRERRPAPRLRTEEIRYGDDRGPTKFGAHNAVLRRLRVAAARASERAWSRRSPRGTPRSKVNIATTRISERGSASRPSSWRPAPSVRVFMRCGIRFRLAQGSPGAVLRA
jgi:hypothetical protein